MPWDTIDAAVRDPVVQRGMQLIGAAVRRRRQRLGWTQRDLERRSGIDQSTISRLENGQRVGLRLARLARLVAALGGLDFGPAPVDSARSDRPKARSIRSMYAQVQQLQEAIYQARIDARARRIETTESEEAGDNAAEPTGASS
jgi:transcriptional regulator with XRE-family HTH domain